MKVKTSISVSEGLLKRIDSLPEKPSRSEIIEKALIHYFKNRKARERDETDLDILNRMASKLNEEALDTLEYQSG